MPALWDLPGRGEGPRGAGGSPPKVSPGRGRVCSLGFPRGPVAPLPSPPPKPASPARPVLPPMKGSAAASPRGSGLQHHLVPVLCSLFRKDRIIFVTKEDHETPSNAELVADDPNDPYEDHGLILPSGDINWNCPCLGGMASGPCGEQFKSAFSCFHYSSEEVKGSDCVDQFRAMQECMQKFPDLYPQEEDEEEKASEATEQAAATTATVAAAATATLTKEKGSS
ncbi:mitochondrial intermembrane space import and assembly protein 40 isoform X1 [Macrotis lagotis]|uniref:mitochondrial intermembrane space import and assembly protein 40 isoform X1 n=1 Tax=Macrotis lagotis TaxID=92651 RepID=UPI003D68D615